MKARTVQAVFRCVLKLDWYGKPNVNYNSEFMCRALDHAGGVGAITTLEYNEAKDAISKYMRSLGTSSTSTMSWALYNAGHVQDPLSAVEWSENAGKEFYRNWNKRPKGALK